MAERLARRRLVLLAGLVLAAGSLCAEPRNHGPKQRGGGEQHQGGRGRGLQEFSPEERQRLQQREQRFRALPDDQQQRLRQAEEHYRSMPPEQRDEVRRRWEGMSESERDRYRRRIENRGD